MLMKDIFLLKAMSKKEITELYRTWRRENGNKMPNRAIVRMRWEDEVDNPLVDTIALQSADVNTNEDAWILYYAGRGLKGLLELLEPNNGSDFVVDEVLEFYKN